ncbi:outer membrane protein transport protein [Myroides phaeus]|uniref:OmpP1/FadL family transporter n=1 Tax=Myroides phaeus TaxID=702745 RepID=UPI002DB600AD|nr:outer membrane protein transport protein [Myroides phaeus]MEC4117780.1 outer membrane protein transport protein [Myroides phaeus]
MNKYFYSLLSAILLTGATYAQEASPGDVMKFNQTDLNGTARFRGMSGAFGAVGGDLSALSINPAGGAIFNYNTAAFTVSYVAKNNKSDYFGNKESKNYNGLDVGQMGALFVFNSYDKDAVMKKFTIGLNYESTKNLRNDYLFRGLSNGNSLGDYFFNIANNNHIPYDVADPKTNDGTDAYIQAGNMAGYDGQQTFLAHETGVILSDKQDGVYSANYATNSAYHQARVFTTSGFSSKFAGTFAAQLGDRFYVGGNLNIHVVDYTQTSRAIERAQTPGEDGTIDIMNFYNSTYTYGTGFSFNLGAIAQVTDELRAGISYESPTWYSLKDELAQGLETIAVGKEESEYIYPQVVNLYDRYRLRTPSKYTGSLAYIFGEKGLISVDYTYKDYSNNELRPKGNNAYKTLNNSIANTTQGTSHIRIGGEYRIKDFSIRGGYRFEQSPYKKDFKAYGDLNSFSTGIGYSFGNSRLDLSYTRTAQSFQTSLVDMTVNNLYSAANIKTRDNFVNLTYNISF